MERSEEESLFYHVTPAKANVIPAKAGIIELCNRICFNKQG